MARIAIIGTGYVGLSAAVCFASRGHTVVASTHDKDKLALIRAKKAPFYEPLIDDMLSQAVESGTLHAVSERREAVLRSDITFVTVGTPDCADGSVNLTFVKQACQDIGAALRGREGYHLVVIKSTVVPGTTQAVLKPIIEQTSKKVAGSDFGLCVNPEFLRQGASIYDMLHPDRVIVGEHDERSGRALHTFYDAFYEGAVPIVRTNLASAEMVKYASNSFLATKISYANEMAGICETIPGIDVSDVMDGVGLDHRINRSFLNAGAGFGGSCFPKDVSALMRFAESRKLDAPLLRAVLAVNKAQAVHVAKLVVAVLGSPRNKKIALLGLAFKPNTDDVREAPSLKIAQILINEGAHVCAYDPAVVEAVVPGFGALRSAKSIGQCLEGAHCCVIVTEWDEFKALNPNDFLTRMSEPIIIDARRIYDPVEFQQKLTYVAVGMRTPYDRSC